MRNQTLIVILMWIIVTSININKSYHIDDAFHLEFSKYVQQNPLTPMSGAINWGDDPTDSKDSNHPPLFFYLIAGHMSLFGDSEISLHILLSVFSFICLFCLSRILQTIKSKAHDIIIILFGFNVSFIVNQNLMTDIPILSSVLGFSYFLVKANETKKMRYYLYSAIAVSLGLLIKYTLLPLVVIYILATILHRQYRYCIFVLIPISTIALWSLINYIEFGGVHITSRGGASITLRSLFDFFTTAGAITPFLIAILFYKVKENLHFLIYIVTILFISFPLFVRLDIIPISIANVVLQYLFVSNGILLFIMLIVSFIKILKSRTKNEFISSNELHFYLVIGGFSAFILLYAPFMATRHILLIIPFILIVFHTEFSKLSNTLKYNILFMSALYGITIGISDKNFADYYKTMAKDIAVPEYHNAWTIGHWGWQWYSYKNGLKQYHTSTSEIKDSAYIIFPNGVMKQNINPKHRIEVIEKRTISPTFFDFFHVSSGASLYHSKFTVIPWKFSNQAIDTIYVCRIYNKE